MKRRLRVYLLADDRRIIETTGLVESGLLFIGSGPTARAWDVQPADVLMSPGGPAVVLAEHSALPLRVVEGRLTRGVIDPEKLHLLGQEALSSAQLSTNRKERSPLQALVTAVLGLGATFVALAVLTVAPKVLGG